MTDDAIVRLRDEAEIRQLITRRSRSVDDRDFEAMGSVCVEEFTLRITGQFAYEANSRQEFVEASAARYARIPEKKVRHYPLNTIVTLDGDRAMADSDMIALVVNDPPKFFMMGRYLDHFVKKDGRWWYASSVIDVSGTDPAFLAGNPDATV